RFGYGITAPWPRRTGPEFAVAYRDDRQCARSGVGHHRTTQNPRAGFEHYRHRHRHHRPGDFYLSDHHGGILPPRRRGLRVRRSKRVHPDAPYDPVLTLSGQLFTLMLLEPDCDTGILSTSATPPVSAYIQPYAHAGPDSAE